MEDGAMSGSPGGLRALAVGVCLLGVCAARAQDKLPDPGKTDPQGDRLPAPADTSRAGIRSIELAVDSLLSADGLQPGDSLDGGARASRFGRVRYRRLPDTAPAPAWLPRLAPRPGRPAEDAGDELLPLVLGPLFDPAHVGHRQELALDGLDPRESSLRIDGLDTGSRITGRADLGGIGLGGDGAVDPWERLDPGRPGGALALETLRADSDSILTRTRWADGFQGFVLTEVDFRRPWLGGRAAAGTRQLFTHERLPGAHYRGNLFFWNFDRALTPGLWMSFDQRIQRDQHGQLVVDDGSRRRRQHLQRLRLEQRTGPGTALDLDLWQVEDADRGDRSAGSVHDVARLRGAALGLRGSGEAQAWRMALQAEHQRLSSGDWKRRQVESQLNGGWRRRLGPGWLRLQGSLGQRSGTAPLPWSLGSHLERELGAWQGALLLQAGRRLPWPEQLHLDRAPTRMDAVADPRWRASGQTLLADPDLAPTSWTRQELRLGWQQAGRTAQLRLWRVALVDQPHPQAGIFNDEPWTWSTASPVHWGQQAYLRWPLAPRLELNLSQAWFREDRGAVSYEYPTWLLDGHIGWRDRWFSGELDLRAQLGAHLERGGVDRFGNPLWGRPEIWLKGSARRGAFTIWWALRNPFGLARPQRVEGLELHGHEEWLGIEWNFLN
jgi:hypothetical protein